MNKNRLQAVRGTAKWVVAASTLLFAAVSCDKDPTQPVATLALTACPSGTQSINSPITLTFSESLLPSAVTVANVIVTDAATGFEIPGSVQLSRTDARQVVFTPNAAFRFDQKVRVRVQNLLSASGSSALNVTVCELQTELPPIREVFWRKLPSASGTDLPGVSLVDSGYAYVLSVTNTLFRYQGIAAPTAIAFPPYFIAANDVSFVSRNHGFVSITNQRNRQTYVIETRDGGATFDSVGAVSFSGLNRVYFRATPDSTNPFGVAGGGASFSPALFLKYLPSSRSFTSMSFSNAGGVSDIDFATDTLLGAASTGGLRIGTRVTLGAVFVSADGGSNWREVPEARAPDSVLTYRGVAVKSNGEIFVVGGNGAVRRLTPRGDGTYAVSAILLPAANPDPTNPSAFLLSDIEFAKSNNSIGWIVGAIQSGVVNGVPRFSGIIFMTRDGGATWTRQGVTEGPNYGAEFPPLNRLDVFSPTVAWAVGAAGTVIRYAGFNAP